MFLREVYNLQENIIQDFRNWWKQWKQDQVIDLPIPPQTNLWHATYRFNLESIEANGLVPNGVCKLYDGCTNNVLYLTDSAQLAVGIVSTEGDTEQNPELVQKVRETGGKALLLQIDATALDPKLLSQDPSFPPTRLDPTYTYMYAGAIPFKHIKVHSEFNAQNYGYYVRKGFRGLTPDKPGIGFSINN
jgi:hypothetical protein